MLVMGNFSDTQRARTKLETSSGKEEHLVQIPAFHTGHLGFVPEKSVLLTGPTRYFNPQGMDERTCEIIVTSHAVNRDILKVSCTFVEAKRVLERLVNLLSHLNVNIAMLESASLFKSKHHIVHMVLDMSESTLSTQPITGSEKSKFIDILPNLRVSSRRGLLLFMNIVSQCHSILTWKEGRVSRGREIPEIYVSEYDPHEWTGETDRVQIKHEPIFYRGRPAESRPHSGAPVPPRRSTFFKLPDCKEERVETLLGITKGRPLDYLLLSDTDSRSLRIQFFQKQHRERIFEVGFKHRDEIGALYTIARTVADSEFNVLSSLIREIDEYHNVWEVVLEYQGPAKKLRGVPKSDPRQAIRRLVRQAAKANRELLAPYDVSVFIPSHLPKWPRKMKGWERGVPLGPAIKGAMPVTPELLDSDKVGPAEQDWLIQYANGLLKKGPTIFISCPTAAKDYRNLLCEKLFNDGWEVSFYDETAKMEATYTEARRLIADSDYFVGIWIPDDQEIARGGGAKADARSTRSANGGRGEALFDNISPWMHFELGQAVAFEREFKILASSELPDAKLVRRIAADKPVFWFEEQNTMESFGNRVDDLLAFMNLNWRDGRRTVRAPDEVWRAK